MNNNFRSASNFKFEIEVKEKSMEKFLSEGKVLEIKKS